MTARAGRAAQCAGAILVLSGLGLLAAAAVAVKWAVEHPETEGHPTAAILLLVGVGIALALVVYDFASERA